MRQVSNLIQTPTGYHIVKVEERQHAGVKPFDEKVQKFIRGKLKAILQDRERDKLVEELQRRTTVKIYAQNP